MAKKTAARPERALARGARIQSGVILCVLAVVLGVWTRLDAKPPAPERAALRAEVKANIVADLQRAGSAATREDASRLADRLMKSGRYAIRTGDYAGTTIDLDREIAQLLPAIESLYTFSYKTDRYWYLPDPDTYHYLAAADRVLVTGRAWARGPDGRERDPWSLAPKGFRTERSWHPRVLAVWHNFLTSIAGDRPLQWTAAWFPVVASVIAALPLMALALIAGGTWAAPCAGALFAFTTAVLGRTFWGHADTDLYNVFFPCAVAALLAWALAKLARRELAGSGAMVALAGGLIGVHARFWIAWWAPWMILGIAVMIAAFALATFDWSRSNRASSDAAMKSIVLLPVAYMLSSLTSVALFAGIDAMVDAWRGPARFAGAALHAPLSGLWPNLFATVGELATPSVADLLRETCGWPAWALAGAGFVLSVMDRERPGRRAIAIFLLAWLAATGALSMRAVRFALLLAPPLVILAGVGAARVGDLVARVSAPVLARVLPRAVTACIVACALVASVILRPGGAASAAHRAALADLPQMNATWGNVLATVRAQTDRLAIVTTWWDAGHPAKFLARRGVSVDGNTFQEPEAVWVARALWTADENESAGIIRMLDAGGASVLDTLTAALGGTARADRVLRTLLAAPDSSTFDATARAARLSNEVVQRVREMVRAPAPRQRSGVLVVSEHLLAEAPTWGAVGAWDFARAAAVREVQAAHGATDSSVERSVARVAGISREEAAILVAELRSVADSERVSWCGRGPTIARGPEATRFDDTGTLRTPSGAWVRFSDGVAGLSPLDGGGTPALVLLPTPDGGPRAIETAGARTDLALMVVPTSSGVSILTTNASLARSTAMRLLYYGSAGLTRFAPLASEDGVRAGAVRAYRVLW